MIASAHPEIDARIVREQERLAQPVTRQRLSDPLSAGICELELYGLPVRQINELERNGYLWLSDLARATEDELRSLPNFGDRCVEHVRAALREFCAVQK